MRLDARLSGESALIERVAVRCTQPSPKEAISVVRGIGDDTAVLQAGGQTLLWTADMLIEGIHFRLDWMDAASLGWKALAVNLSDIAAMGGEPIGALLSIALPPERTGAWFDAFLDGFLECARAFDTALIGGDTNRAERMVVDVSVLGRVDGAPVLRSGAQAGDWLMVTGALGGSRAGLESLFAGRVGTVDLTSHFRPTPRLQAGRLARQLGATAMMDLSDGLAADLPKLLRASGKGAIVYADKVPVHPVVSQWAQSQERAVGVVGGDADATVGGFVGGDADATRGVFVGGDADATREGFVGGDADATQGGFVGEDADATVGGFVGEDADATVGGFVGGDADATREGFVGGDADATREGFVGGDADATRGGFVGEDADATRGVFVGEDADATVGGFVGVPADDFYHSHPLLTSPMLLALTGGEDYELLIAAPPAIAERMLAQIPSATGVALSVIGEVIDVPELWLQHPDGRRESFALSGWDHFAG